MVYFQDGRNRKEPGPTAQRVAAAIRRVRHGERDITTAELSRRLAAIGYPIADTGITKAEKGDRRVDVDDLVPLALALGVTPNTLLLPTVDHIGAADIHQLTPEVSGTAEELWQWAQGERPLILPVPGGRSYLGGAHPYRDFAILNRPYLTAPHPASAENPDAHPAMREMTSAIFKAQKAGATDAEVRRAVELTLSLPVIMVTPEYRERLRRGMAEEAES